MNPWVPHLQLNLNFWGWSIYDIFFKNAHMCETGLRIPNLKAEGRCYQVSEMSKYM